MRYTLDEQQCRNLEVSTHREWVLTNGIGGFAMGTAGGINTRRYHAHLVAATTPPTGRMVLLAAVDAFVQTDGNPMGISSNQYPGAIYPEGFHYLKQFSVGRSATWKYRASGSEITKHLTIHPGENAVTVRYKNEGITAVNLMLRPLVCHRDHHANFYEHSDYPEQLLFLANETVVVSGGIPLHISHGSGDRIPVQGWYYRFEHSRETDRGLPDRDDLFCPCELRYRLKPGEEAVLVASTNPGTVPYTEPEDVITRDIRMGTQLKESALKFLVQTKDRSTIMAGYPWFTDWGRDTMISIPGVCLATGQVAVARQILRDYAFQCRKGLVLNRFVEQGETPDYNTVDATLWFVNAIYKTLQKEWDEAFAVSIIETLEEIYEWHLRGTEFGIKVDSLDGLLTQGEAGVQLTWMDAKVGEWVVTPRHGKPIEINSLWINSLRILEWLSGKLLELGTPLRFEPEQYRADAIKGEASFESKFWHEGRGHYLDTVDPADASLRPNQVIAMSLPFAPFDPQRARRALGIVARELVTPNGLRTLGPEESGYRGKYSGPMAELDAAYHQGTVWPWLLGPYISSIVKYNGDKKEAKLIMRNVKAMMEEYGIGGVAEVYDGDGPQSPGGCPWQAWSVAEILRAYAEDLGGDSTG